jgi:uracil-DNA glycosylase family 4
MSRRRDLLLYLRDLGFSDVESAAAAPDAPGSGGPAGQGLPDTLDGLATAHADCRRCGLCRGRTHVVFGVGAADARLMFIGEGPGADEDRLGEPFVGRAGQLLNAMIEALGLRRRDVYIANIVKCRPPGNRDPQEDEAATCLPFLHRQIELVDPTVIVTLGRVASHHLLGNTAPISTYRGRWQRWNDRDVLATFHPAYLLRTPSAKAQAWADLKKVMRRLETT